MEDRHKYITVLEVRDTLNEISELIDCLYLVLNSKDKEYRSYTSNPHVALTYHIKELIDSLEEKIKVGCDT